MNSRKRFSLSTAWYALIVLASVMPAIAMAPWLAQQAHSLLLDRSIMAERLIHHDLEITLALETQRISSVLANKADGLAQQIFDDYDEDTINQLVQKTIERDKSLNTVTLYDKHARIIGASHSDTHTSAKINPDSPLFTIPMTGQEYIGSVSELADGHFELLISVPVFLHGIPSAVLAGTVNTNQLWANIQKDSFEHVATTYLVDHQGALLIDVPNVDFKQGDSLADKAVVRSLLDGNKWQETNAYRGLDGEEVFGITSQIANLKWGIISEIPSSTILAPIIDALLILTVIIFLLHIVFGAISLVISRFLLSPVSDLVKVMKTATAGDYQQITKHERFEEVAALTSSFNTMINEIQHRETSLLKLSQAIEQAGESVIITDTNATIEYVNPSFTKITGYTAEEVLGQNPRILKSGNQPAEYYKKMWKTIVSGDTWRSNIVDRRKDGTLYPAIVTIAPIFNEEGQITHYVGTQQDMTENKQLEERFRQSQKMEAIGVLVGGIAHDFNNMLAAVTSHLHLAKDLVHQPEKVVAKIEQIEKLTFGASDMVKQLLMFSRKAHIEMQPVGLISFIKEISKVCKAGIPENIAFHVAFHHEELIVEGDATQLQQVIMNLLNNARDALSHTQNPELQLTINLYKADADFTTRHPDETHHQFAHIEVKDNGPGITEKDKAHIFEPFYTTKEVGLGTGLGLSMAYGVIENHHGIIEVDSAPGKGTSFHIYLPLLEVGRPLVEAAAPSSTITGNGELILLVDDNADVRHTAKTVLTKLGYRVIEAIDGLNAVDVFTDHQDEIALVITDVVMPKLGGVQTAERLRSMCPDTKVIFITGYDAGELLKGDTASALTAVVTKPYRVNHLSKVVADLLHS